MITTEGLPLGALDHLIVIEQPTNTVVNGEATSAWAEVVQLKAAREAVGGIETPLTADVEYRFHTHYVNRAFTPRMRIREGTRVFQIVSVLDPTGRKRKLLFRALEIVG